MQFCDIAFLLYNTIIMLLRLKRWNKFSCYHRLPQDGAFNQVCKQLKTVTVAQVQCNVHFKCIRWKCIWSIKAITSLKRKKMKKNNNYNQILDVPDNANTISFFLLPLYLLLFWLLPFNLIDQLHNRNTVYSSHFESNG